MDPAFAIATAVGTGVAKGAGTAAGNKVFAVLTNRTQRWRVAWAVSKAARTEGILIGWRVLSRWLKPRDARAVVASGDRAALARYTDRLVFKIETGGPSLDVAAARIVELVRDESLRRMAEGDGRVAATRRLEDAIEAAASGQRAVLVGGVDETAFEAALKQLHPWRAEEASSLAQRWRPFRPLAITLAAERNRRLLLQQWGETPPTGLKEAPPECWCWFASVAADYGAIDAALSFLAKGVETGGSASYWWARAGVMVGTGTSEDAARARDLWARSTPKHPMAAAGEALVRGDFAASERSLKSWVVDNPTDRSIKAILQSAAATGRGDLNRAIAISVAEAEASPEGAGNAVRAAEALVSRGSLGRSDHPLRDFAKAFELAIQARDARRAWLGDSVSPILTAVKAAALATDIEQAWRLTQPAPDGDALPHEAQDQRLRRETAILAATMGRFENAEIIAEEVGDPFVSCMVEGWQFFTNDRPADAEGAWLRAWDHAPDDESRLRAAAALAPLGMRLPDLGTLSDEFSMAIDRVRNVHEVMSNSDEDMSLLRARATESEQLTVLLAERLMAQGQAIDAAAILEAGGTRWHDPLLMRMAAGRYMVAGSYERALEAVNMALSLGGAAWPGRLEALMIQFDSLEAQGQFARSLAVAREMVAIAPSNLTVRWAFIHSLVRDGNIADAWNALTYEGKPVPPRDPGDARIWIGLAAECDNSTDFVQRAMTTMRAWSSDPDVVAVFLLQIYRGLQRHDRDVADSDINELRRATEEFTEAHPESQILRTVSLDEKDPLGSLIPLLKQHFSEGPEIRIIRERLENGELPLGLAGELYNRTYAEASIKAAAGLVYSHHPQMASGGRSAAINAFGKRVVIDTSAAATLSLLDPGVVDGLLGVFLALETTDSAFRDALGAQQSLNMLPTMALGWDDDSNQPRISQTSLEDAKEFARRSDRVVKLLTRSSRRGWPGPKHFAGAGDGAWLSALDLAISDQEAFWCDDRALRQIALSEGAQAFGTVDLLMALEATGHLEPSLGAAIRARLVAAYHVDLDWATDVMELAAEIENWMPKGAAAALTRVHSWARPTECVRFAAEAMARVAPTAPTAITDWTAAVGLGLVRIADGDHEGAGENLKILLTLQLAQPWLRPDTLPFVMDGIRAALVDLPGTTDPLRPVLARTYSQIAERHGAPQAAEFILMLVKNLREEDRMCAARIILTNHV